MGKDLSGHLTDTHVKDWDRLRSQHEIARNALIRADKAEFKRYSSAKWADYVKDEHGVVTAKVQHDDLKGVTPEMILWWFEHLADSTTWNGVDFSGPKVSLYHLWHNRDHVAVTPLTDVNGKKNEGFLEGAKSRIHELTNEVNDVIYYEMETVELNTHTFTFNVMFNGKATGHVKHVYGPTPDGTGSTFYAETMVGIQEGGAVFNRTMVPKLYSKDQGMQWIAHNIQETGRLEDIAPILYANQDKVFYDPEMIKFD
ncbi:MAG: hypothetical protein ACK5NA_07245 [Enterococcus sp.]